MHFMAAHKRACRDKAVLCLETLDPIDNFALLYRIYVPKRELQLKERLKCPC